MQSIIEPIVKIQRNKSYLEVVIVVSNKLNSMNEGKKAQVANNHKVTNIDLWHKHLSHLGVEYAKLLAWKKLVERFILKKHTIEKWGDLQLAFKLGF
jgi:hypothetical protein